VMVLLLPSAHKTHLQRVMARVLSLSTSSRRLLGIVLIKSIKSAVHVWSYQPFRSARLKEIPTRYSPVVIIFSFQWYYLVQELTRFSHENSTCSGGMIDHTLTTLLPSSISKALNEVWWNIGPST
jgi:hypothetical protein